MSNFVVAMQFPSPDLRSSNRCRSQSQLGLGSLQATGGRLSYQCKLERSEEIHEVDNPYRHNGADEAPSQTQSYTFTLCGVLQRFKAVKS